MEYGTLATGIKLESKIKIGEHVTIAHYRNKQGRIKIAITAPKDMKITREGEDIRAKDSEYSGTYKRVAKILQSMGESTLPVKE